MRQGAQGWCTEMTLRDGDVDPEKGEVCLQSWEDNRHVGEGGGR